jgi:hypothetical protein
LDVCQLDGTHGTSINHIGPLTLSYNIIQDKNFQEGGEEIKAMLKRLEKLVRLLLPSLYAFLSEKGVLHFFFCYRWVLIWLKREFAFDVNNILEF